MKWQPVQLLFLLLASGLSIQAAEQFGDISVGASAIFTGNTYHGYAEMRVMLENHSHDKSHVVTLIYPNDVYGNYGNSIGRVSRSVTIGPDAREIVTLLQPPLPAQGDGSIRVEVDQRHVGEVHAPNANGHCSASWRGANRSATVFISRSLDFDSVERVFKASRGAFTPAMAVGPPDAVRGSAWQNCWMPDARRRGGAAWLELDYAKPQTVDNIAIHCGFSTTLTGSIELVGTSGTNIATLPMASAVGSARPSAHGSAAQIMTSACPLTAAPVKTVRLNFGAMNPGSISIDAVEISGPAGSQWASDARASSDNAAAAGSYGAADEIESLRAESPVTEWSENWLAYSPFDCVVLNAADMSSMPPAVQGALGDYLSTGGNVVVAGAANFPAAWHPLYRHDIKSAVEYRVGFGRCQAFTSDDFSKLNSDSIRSLREMVRNSARYWQSLPRDSGGANSVLPVVASLKIPTRGIVIIMLAFIIAIGPVNIICLNRWKRRTWMLWTIPAISLATTLIVFVYSLLREGITPDARIAGLTLIDQASHHAATIGGTAFYCPLTPSSGLHFEFDTEATPLVENGYNSGTTREVDWSQFQQFRRGWLMSRVPAYFHVRKPETRRERIQVIDENGKLQIVNGLGAPIQSLWFASADMKVYRADNVAAGDKAGLTIAKGPLNLERSGTDGLWRKIGFAAPIDGTRPKTDNGAAEFLLPNTYIAVLDGNPFIENALGPAASAKRTKSSGLVFGFLEPSGVK